MSEHAGHLIEIGIQVEHVEEYEELDGLGALLTVGPLHRHGRRVAVALQVDAVMGKAQRYLDAGASFALVGADVQLLSGAARTLADKFSKKG